MGTTIISNVIKQDALRKVQIETLEELSKVLKMSFGPNGSNTCIKKDNVLPQYTKDGHTILKNIRYNGVIEDSIKEDIESITRHVVATVGDGTTSSVILAELIMKALIHEKYSQYLPSEVLYTFDKEVNRVKDKIQKNGRECTIEDIYDICMISTNGNEFVSQSIADIYKESGLGVFIDVSAALSNETVLKTYDGMTINTGFSDSIYVTNQEDNTAEVDNPNIYIFEDPIDTKEMSVFLDAIIATNIVNPLEKFLQTNDQNETKNIVPTVIVAPKISQDLSSVMDRLTNYMSRMSANNRLPILLISGTHQHAELMDIAKLAGCKPIHKYIDSEIYKSDVEKGLAPTPETVFNWAGNAEKVVADSGKTKFINPQFMRDEDGEYSMIYNNLLSFLEAELKRAVSDGEDAMYTGKLKRRINSLKSNMVEYFVGGITASDRDAVRDLVEDAVKNCRSAVEYGVGWGANFNAYNAIREIIDDESKDKYNIISDLTAEIREDLKAAYTELVTILYRTVTSEEKITKMLNDMRDMEQPFNIRTKAFDGKVKCSIESDMVIIDSMSKIVGIMATCNQFITPSSAHAGMYRTDL